MFLLQKSDQSVLRRDSWLDYDKGISIILVSFRHCYESVSNTGLDVASYPAIEYINLFLFGFRMPLFFIASGIFFSSSIAKRGLGKYTMVRIQNILYPMLVWGCIQITLQILFSLYTNTFHDFRDYVSLITDPRKTGQFWYLNALFFVGLLYAFLKVKININIYSQLALGLLMYLSVSLLRQQFIYLGFLMDILQFYLFFAIGDAISTSVKSDQSKKLLSSYWPLFFLLPLFFLVQYYFTDINMKNQDSYYVEHHMPFFYLLVASVGCLLSINISFILSKHNVANFIRLIGFHSIYIFCMQIILMAAVRILLIKVFMITYIPFLLLVILLSGIALPIVAYYLFVKMKMQWLFTFNPAALKFKFT